MTAKSTSLPEWAGGVWYDPELLPEIPTGYGKQDEERWKLINGLCERSWDIITKFYDPATDDFQYKRVSLAMLCTHEQQRKKSYRWSPVEQGHRVVAIMPHPDWRFVYETRLKVDIVKAAADAVADLDKKVPDDWEFKS